MKFIQQLLLIISVWTLGLHTTGTIEPDTIRGTEPQCVTNLPPFGQRGGPSFNTSYELVLIPTYKFSCYGNVTKWLAYFPQAVNSTDQFLTYSIIFEVWRPKKSILFYNKCYRLIGSNRYASQHVQRSGLFSANVPINNQIAVEPDDIVGVSLAKGLRMDQERAVVLWYKRPTIIGTIIIPTILSSVCVPLIVGQISTITSTRAYAPVITAVLATFSTTQPIPSSTIIPTQVPTIYTHTATLSTMQPIPSSTHTINPTPVPTPHQPTYPPSGLSAGSIVGISIAIIAVLTLLIIIPLVIILAVMLFIRKKRSGNSVPSHTYKLRPRQPHSDNGHTQLARTDRSGLNVLNSNVGNELFVMGSNISYGIHHQEGDITVDGEYTDDQDSEYINSQDATRVGYVESQDARGVAGEYLEVIPSFASTEEPADYEVMVPSIKPTEDGIQEQTQAIYEEVR